MDNIEYLKSNIAEVKDILSDLETRTEGGEPGLGATIHTFRRHLKDLENQVTEAEKELAAIG